MNEPVYRFGGFSLDPGRRRLLKDGEPVAVGARAFDILHLLLRHHDRFVEKEEIIRAVWPNSIVEDNNLTVHVSALRKHLDAEMIQTVPGRGYRFAAPVEIEPEGQPTAEGITTAESERADAPPNSIRQRWRLPWIGAALLSIAIVGAVLLGSSHLVEPWSSADRRASNVILSAENLSSDPELDQVARQFTDAAKWNLSDNSLLTATIHAVDHATQLSDAELRDIGNRFDSHFVVTYALRRDGDGIAVNASVIDVRSGSTVFADGLTTTAYRTLAEQRILAAEFGVAIVYAELAIEIADAGRLRPNALDAWDLTARAEQRLRAPGH